MLVVQRNIPPHPPSSCSITTPTQHHFYDLLFSGATPPPIILVIFDFPLPPVGRSSHQSLVLRIYQCHASFALRPLPAFLSGARSGWEGVLTEGLVCLSCDSLVDVDLVPPTPPPLLPLHPPSLFPSSPNPSPPPPPPLFPSSPNPLNPLTP